jgi:cytochrome c biogenesis protein
MVEGKRTESPMDKVWKFFTSLKLAIFVIIILAVASIIGTIIEQNQPLEKYRQLYSDGTIRLFESLNLFDMYHSWWFLLLLVLLTVNLSCCTLDRLPRTVKVVRNPKTTLDDNLEKSLAHVDRWKKKGGMEELADTYKTAMGSAFASPRVTENSGTLHLYAEKGVVSRFGVYVTHLSIIIIFIGAIIGNVFGFKGFANIVEGESVRTIPTRGGTNQVDLGFAVRCNKFRVDFYPTGQPKEYSSDLSVIEGGREVVRKTIEVNDPLQYKGIWFYQASYGPAGAASATVAVNSPDGGRMETFSLTPGQKVEIPGYGKVSGIDYQNDFQGLGPALLVVLEKHGKPPAEFWLLKAYPNFDRQRGDTRYLSFAGVDQIFYTGLQVAQDPGVNIVWVGCTLMVIGIMIAFFMSHQRLWIRLSRGGDGRVEVVLAGSTNKNRLAFEKRFEKIQADMKAVGA